MVDKNKQTKSSSASGFSSQRFDVNLRQSMLSLAREAIRDYLQSGTISRRVPEASELTEPGAVFVTLWSPSIDPNSKTGEKLRGCIGQIGTSPPLYIGIQDSAVNAAFRDPRFPPLELHELDKIRIEIAILSEFHEITDLKEISVGTHGLLITGLGKRGLLLPKVAVRLNLNRSDFFAALCKKAGLPITCWPASANLYTFTTITFKEKSKAPILNQP